MKLPVVFTAEARDDLRSILDHIADDGVTAALRVVDRIEQDGDLLGDAFLRYPLVPDTRQAASGAAS